MKQRKGTRFGVWSDPFRVWMFECKLREQVGETAAGRKREGKRNGENGWVGSGGSFEGVA